jgi:hypothetical protein
MAACRERWPDRFVHVDGGFWSRQTHYKVAIRERWAPLAASEYDDSRLRSFGVMVRVAREPGRRMLVCGMSRKACADWGIPFQSWERAAIETLTKAGAEVIYRPKPNAPNNGPLDGAKFDESAFLEPVLAQIDGVATHHSNCGVDALAAGLPIFTEAGIAKPLSVEHLADLPGATAPDIGARTRLLSQIAWHQWSCAELARGTWLNPPAPLSDDPLFKA